MNATAQHYRLENERLQKQVKHLEEETSRLAGLEASNRSLQEQLDQHSGRLAEAHALGELIILAPSGLSASLPAIAVR